MSYVITRATEAHLSALPEVELQAAALFKDQDVPPQVLTETTSLEDFRAALRSGYLWVVLDATGNPVGFAEAQPLPESLHLAELAVTPAHGRRGLGRALVETVCACARAEGRAAVTLTTFRIPAWNAPFYGSLGFEILPREALTASLATIVEREAQRGLPAEQRVVMRKGV